MADINIKRFVDVDIVQHVQPTIVGTRGTVVLYTGEGTKGTTQLVESLSDAASKYANAPTTLAYLKVFFENGGVSALVVEGTPYANVNSDVLSALDDKYIVVCYAAPKNDTASVYTALKGIATTREANVNIYGVDEKIILARTETVDSDSVKNFGVKYSKVLGAEMTIAAYLSQINVYKTNTVSDYMFTKEAITAETLTDTEYQNIIGANCNVDVYLANSVRNMGGNLKNGADLVNSYTLIVLHQTLTERLLELLATKIKGSKGLAQIYATIAQELEAYRSCGYLTTDKIWSEEDLVVTYNSQNYTVITKGTPLNSGYAIKVLPFSSLTVPDKTERKTPPIYVIIADQYGIRKITVNGEVI